MPHSIRRRHAPEEAPHYRKDVAQNSQKNSYAHQRMNAAAALPGPSALRCLPSPCACIEMEVGFPPGSRRDRLQGCGRRHRSLPPAMAAGVSNVAGVGTNAMDSGRLWMRLLERATMSARFRSFEIHHLVGPAGGGVITVLPRRDGCLIQNAPCSPPLLRHARASAAKRSATRASIP